MIIFHNSLLIRFNKLFTHQVEDFDTKMIKLGTIEKIGQKELVNKKNQNKTKEKKGVK
jgi:hypothetical protein